MLNKTKQNWLIDCSVLFGFVQYCTSQCPLLLRMRLRRCLSCFAIDAVAFPAMFGSIKSSGCPLFFGNQPASLPKQQLQVGRRRRRRRRRRPPLGHWGGLQRQPACSDSQCRSSGGGLAANGCGWILQQVDEIVGVDYVGACEFRNFLDRSEEEVRGRSSLLAWRVLVPLTVVPGFDLNEELRPPPWSLHRRAAFRCATFVL